MAIATESLITMKSLGTPKALSLTKKEWDGYLASTLNFFINTPSGGNKEIVIEAMKLYQHTHKTSSFKLPDKGKSK